MLNYNKNLKEYSRRLRKEMTDAERELWVRIRGKQLRGYQFYRQKPIGDFIADLYCPKANLVKIPLNPPFSKGEVTLKEGNPQKSRKNLMVLLQRS